MNQRIRELITPKLKEWGGASGDNFSRELEQFAQLIVRECAKVADDGFASSNFGNGITGHQLLKHFGVEE